MGDSLWLDSGVSGRAYLLNLSGCTQQAYTQLEAIVSHPGGKVVTHFYYGFKKVLFGLFKYLRKGTFN